MRPERAALALFVAGLAALPLPSRAADEGSLRLADGTGRERVQAACSMCHSLDYILMNSPFQDRAAWQKTVDGALAAVNETGAHLITEEPPASAWTNDYIQQALDALAE